jgi:hypothetical protein
MHYSYAQTPRRQVNVMELKAVFQFVSPKVREAAMKTATHLTDLNIHHILAMRTFATKFIHTPTGRTPIKR